MPQRLVGSGPLGRPVPRGRVRPCRTGRPDDPATVEGANTTPDVFAEKSVGAVALHCQAVIERLDKKPRWVPGTCASPTSWWVHQAKTRASRSVSR
jgi:hypothetical protein